MVKRGVTKKVESSSSFLSNAQQEVLRGITNFLTITQIAKYRKTSRASVYSILKGLEKKNLIKKIGRLIELTDKGKETLHSLTRSKKLIRLHNLVIKVKILESHLNWELKRNKIFLIKGYEKTIGLNNNSYDFLRMQNIRIKTTSKSILLELPNTYGKNTDEAFKKALDLFFEVIPKIENRLNIKLMKDSYLNIEIISQHYAKLQDSLARLYRIKDKKFHVKEGGEVWLIVDYSFRTDELETINIINAKEDMDIVQGFFNHLRNNPKFAQDLASKQSLLEVNVNTFAKNLEAYNKNIELHIKVQEEQLKTQRETQETMGKIREGVIQRQKPFFVRWFEFFINKRR